MHVLAIILFKYKQLDPSARGGGGKKGPRGGEKNCRGAAAPPPCPPTFRAPDISTFRND